MQKALVSPSLYGVAREKATDVLDLETADTSSIPIFRIRAYVILGHIALTEGDIEAAEENYHLGLQEAFTISSKYLAKQTVFEPVRKHLNMMIELGQIDNIKSFCERLQGLREQVFVGTESPESVSALDNWVEEMIRSTCELP